MVTTGVTCGGVTDIQGQCVIVLRQQIARPTSDILAKFSTFQSPQLGLQPLFSNVASYRKVHAFNAILSLSIELTLKTPGSLRALPND